MRNVNIAVAAVVSLFAAVAGARSMLRPSRPIVQSDEAAQEVKSSPLFRRAMAVIGDSYVQNHRRPIEETWHYRLAEKYQMEYFNYGLNGNRMVNASDKKRGVPMIGRFAGMVAPVEYVVVIGGHNDANYIDGKDLRKAGKSKEECAAAGAERYAEFADGLVKFVEGLKAKYPASDIVFVTPWNIDAPAFRQVLECYRKTLPPLGVHLFDAAAIEAIDPNSAECREKLFQTRGDKAHLNFEGHGIVLAEAEKFFNALPPVEIVPKVGFFNTDVRMDASLVDYYAPIRPSSLADDSAEAEGIQVKWLSTIAGASGQKLKIEKMALDETGYPQPTGEFEELDADAVVLAVGQNVDRSMLDKLEGLNMGKDAVVIDEQYMTSIKGIFAAGDMATSDRTVTHAIGMGKSSARCVDAYLKGNTYTKQPKHQDAKFEDMHPWYYTDAPKQVRSEIEMARRTGTFDEVQHGLTEDNAIFEARRCLSCGNCMECDNCYGVCPDNAIKKLGPGQGYEFNYDYCKGCGVCAQECPCGHIAMEPEKI